MQNAITMSHSTYGTWQNWPFGYLEKGAVTEIMDVYDVPEERYCLVDTEGNQVLQDLNDILFRNSQDNQSKWTDYVYEECVIEDVEYFETRPGWQTAVLICDGVYALAPVYRVMVTPVEYPDIELYVPFWVLGLDIVDTL